MYVWCVYQKTFSIAAAACFLTCWSENPEDASSCHSHRCAEEDAEQLGDTVHTVDRFFGLLLGLWKKLTCLCCYIGNQTTIQCYNINDNNPLPWYLLIFWATRICGMWLVFFFTAQFFLVISYDSNFEPQIEEFRRRKGNVQNIFPNTLNRGGCKFLGAQPKISQPNSCCKWNFLWFWCFVWGDSSQTKDEFSSRKDLVFFRQFSSLTWWELAEIQVISFHENGGVFLVCSTRILLWPNFIVTPFVGKNISPWWMLLKGYLLAEDSPLMVFWSLGHPPSFGQAMPRVW